MAKKRDVANMAAGAAAGAYAMKKTQEIAKARRGVRSLTSSPMAGQNRARLRAQALRESPGVEGDFARATHKVANASRSLIKNAAREAGPSRLRVETSVEGPNVPTPRGRAAIVKPRTYGGASEALGAAPMVIGMAADMNEAKKNAWVGKRAGIVSGPLGGPIEYGKKRRRKA